MGAMSFFSFLWWLMAGLHVCASQGGSAQSRHLLPKVEAPTILHAPNLHSDEIVIFDVCSGPMMALCLAREDAVEGWRELLGPKEVTVAAEQAPERYKLPDVPT